MISVLEIASRGSNLTIIYQRKRYRISGFYLSEILCCKAK